MSAQDSFMDRRHWRQTHKGNYLREMGPFMVFLFRCGGNDKWAYSIRSNEAQPERSMQEARQAAFVALAEAVNSIVAPKPPGRFKTVDPFILPDDAEMIDG
jgi:hypothetical protein